MEKPTLIYVIICMLAVAIILLLFVLKKLLGKEDLTGITEKLKTDIAEENANRYALISSQLGNMATAVSEQFSRSRMEEAQREKQLRDEVNAQLNSVNENLKVMNKDNYEQRIQLTKAIGLALDDIRKTNSEQNEKQNKILENSITKLQLSNEQKLEQMRHTVDEKLNATLASRLDSSFKTVSEQLENVYKSLGEMKVLSTGVTDNVTSLNRILTNVKARGTWAEIQLETILVQTIPGMFDKNVMPNPASRDIVEFAVKIPSNDNKDEFTYLPIDSKFPMEDYIRLCDAADRADPAGVDEARKALERRVLACAKDISKYIHEPDTTPFAIMYLATEGLYSEIISSPNGIAERIQNEFNVMVSGPSTITALLNSLAMGFRAIAINEKAKEVRVLLASAKVQYEKFGDVLARAKKKIEEAGKTLDDAQSRNSIIQKKLRTVEEIDADVAADILGLEE